LHRRRTAGLVAAGLVLLVAAPAAAAPATVTVRVEGQERSLVEPARVTTTTDPVNKSGKPGEDCSGTSAAGALERATAGDWSGTYFAGLGYFVTTIRGERHPGDPDFWTLWVNHRQAQLGLCGTELQEGDDVLFYVDRCEFDTARNACANEPVLPLALSAPRTATAGDTVEVTVVRYDANGATAPVAGAQVTGAAAPTDAAGRASVPLPAAGTVTLRADKPGFARSEPETVTVSDAPRNSPAPAARDTVAPKAVIAGLRKRYARGRGPRVLRGTVSPDPSGLRVVKLRLTRRAGGRCAYYSGRRERFRPTRCGRAFRFAIGDRARWSYLLPARLGHGRYALEVTAVDGAGNRGATQALFTVR
jgi:hypothetical protein